MAWQKWFRNKTQESKAYFQKYLANEMLYKALRLPIAVIKHVICKHRIALDSKLIRILICKRGHPFGRSLLL